MRMGKKTDTANGEAALNQAEPKATDTSAADDNPSESGSNESETTYKGDTDTSEIDTEESGSESRMVNGAVGLVSWIWGRVIGLVSWIWDGITGLIFWIWGRIIGLVSWIRDKFCSVGNQGDDPKEDETERILAIFEAVEEFADPAPNSQSAGGALRQKLSQEDVRAETLVEQLDLVATKANAADRIASELPSEGTPPKSLDVDVEDPVVEHVSAVLDAYHELEGRIEQLQGEKEQLESEKSDLEDEKKDLEDKNESLREQNGQLEEQIEDYERREQSLEESVSTICQETSVGLGNQEGAVERAAQLATHAENGRLDVPHGTLAAGQILEADEPNATSELSRNLLATLRDAHDGLPVREELEQTVQRFDEVVTTQSRLEQADRPGVHKKADRVRDRADEVKGVAADVIGTEIDERLLPSVENANYHAPVYAADRTLKHFESILDGIDEQRGVDASVEELIDEIDRLDENIEWFIKNRPYNHEIPKYIRSGISSEVHAARDLATRGETERAIGRLQTAIVVFELLTDVYNKPEYNTVLEIAAQ